ncbi:hypothetical protein BST61_g3928 [Cercospora zeina]
MSTRQDMGRHLHWQSGDDRNVGSEQEQETTATDGDAQISKEEYRKLVDFYRHYGPATTETESYHLPLASRLILTPEQEQAAAQLRTTGGEHQAAQPDDHEQRKIIAKLSNNIMLSRLGYVCPNLLWTLYQQISAPRPRYLETTVLHRFLHHLGFVERWLDKDAMQRYFQLLDDCVAEGVPLDKNNWTTAISFAGRWVQHTTANEVQAAIETWMRMEEQGHAADHVTLNVLFDVAVKGGRFALADTIYKEIKARELPLDRYFRGSLIYFGGMKRNGDEVRRAFREFVEAGEIVDTTLMNSVIISLLRAGEAPAAEQVFNKMKRLAEEKLGGPAAEQWQERKELRSELNVAAQRLRAESEAHGSSFFGASFSSFDQREKVQKIAPIAPDALTYSILLKYHSILSGDADRVWELLNEMGEQGLQPQTVALVHILKGFCVHGGYALSAWTHHRLEEFWKVAVQQVEVDVPTARLAHSDDVHQTGAPDNHAQPKSASDSLAVQEDVPSLQIENDDEWWPDDESQYDKSQYDDDEPNQTSPLSLGGSIPKGDAGNSTSRSSLPPTTDDFDMLGAMLSDPTAETRDAVSHGDLEKQPQEAQPASRTSSAPTSFLESVSLRHLTDAALLPESGSALENIDESSQKKPVGMVSSESDATSSFLDSLIPESDESMLPKDYSGEQTDDAARHDADVTSQLMDQPDDFNSANAILDRPGTTPNLPAPQLKHSLGHLSFLITSQYLFLLTWHWRLCELSINVAGETA